MDIKSKDTSTHMLRGRYYLMPNFVSIFALASVRRNAMQEQSETSNCVFDELLSHKCPLKKRISFVKDIPIFMVETLRTL